MTGRGQGRNRGGRGRGSYASAAAKNSTYTDGNQSEAKKTKSSELLTLSGAKPGSNMVMPWIRSMHAHAGQEFSRNSLHWLLHPSIPRDPDVITRPDRPDATDYDDDDEEKMDEADFKIDMQIYMDDLKEYKKKQQQLKEDKVKLFNLMASHIDEGFKTSLPLTISQSSMPRSAGIPAVFRTSLGT